MINELENSKIFEQLLSEFTKELRKISMNRNDDHNLIISLDLGTKEYLEFIKENRSANYLRSVLTSINKTIGHFEPQRIINTINLIEAEKFITRLRTETTKGYRTDFRNIRAMFSKFVDWGYISSNPFKKIKLPKRQKIRPTFITEKELHQICNEIELDIVRDFITLAFYTGLRLNELIHLKWQNIDFESRIITVGDEVDTTKNYQQRYVPMFEIVFEILSKIKKEQKHEQD